jgi:hypothetical protein
LVASNRAFEVCDSGHTIWRAQVAPIARFE